MRIVLICAAASTLALSLGCAPEESAGKTNGAATSTPGAAPALEAPLDVRGPAEAKFASAPKVEAAGSGFKISFTVSAPTDVEVAILDAKGKVVRHLAAGLLGKNAPAPLAKDSLAQTLVWDGKNDIGLEVGGGRLQDASRPQPPTPNPQPFSVRVRLGSSAQLEKYLGVDNAGLDRVGGLAVGAGGELFVLSRSWVKGRTDLKVYDRSGKYLRTIMPYPAATPAERLKSVGQLTVGGERVPVIFNGHSESIHPLTVSLPRQNLAWNPKGHLVAASTLATAYEHGLPRHLLAFHPQGGAPDGMNFVGPELRPPTGVTWGHGEGDDPCFDHVACSPDGKWVYYAGATFQSMHAVYRLAWGEAHGSGMEAGWFGQDNRPGSDDKHLNDPAGLAVDAAGNVYVCDRGNNRIAVISPEAKLLGSIAVEDPEQIAVHPKTGEIYVLCRQSPPGTTPKDIGPMSTEEYRAWKARVAERAARAPAARAPKFLKLGAWKAGEPAKTLAQLDEGLDLMALDGEATPPVIWATGKAGLRPIVDRGDKLEPGAPLSSTGGGISHPGRVVADPERNRVLVYNLASNYKVNAFDLATGAKTLLLDSVSDFAVAPDGSIYGLGKFSSNEMLRFSADGKPSPFPGSDKNVVKIAPIWIGGINLGARGMTVSPSGDVYLLRANGEKGVQSRLDVFGPDGKLKKAALVDGLGIGDCGVGVDPAGNVYLGVNVKPRNALLPRDFAGVVPQANWLCWAQWSWHYRPEPWHYSMRNEYLYHYGSAMKFGPAGGAFYRGAIGFDEAGKPIGGGRLPLEAAPQGSAEYLSGYLYGQVKAAGIQWRYAGMGIVPASERQWGDPSCVCMSSRLGVDG
ncbi:MAG TPA: hypothetical protein PK280_13350, partial [Planctomycetota bacterium]|nr:hypothetical protein [Planctomycetota bacterium]